MIGCDHSGGVLLERQVAGAHIMQKYLFPAFIVRRVRYAG